MYYHWYFKVALLLCSDSCKIYIYRTAIHISKRCNSCNQSISISVVKLLTLYLQNFCLWYIAIIVTGLIKVVPLNEFLLIYSKSSHWHIISFILIYLIHMQYSYDIFKVLRVLLLIYSLHYYWYFILLQLLCYSEFHQMC